MAKKPTDIWGIPFPSLPSGQDVINYMANTVRTAQVASGDREPIPGSPDSYGVREMGRGISMTNDYLNPFANSTKQLLGMASGNPGSEAKFAKSLAKDAAFIAAGVGVGAGAIKGAKALQKTGLPARVVNKVKGETILIHGSPDRNLPVIEPRYGSNRLPDDEVAFGWNPKVFYPDNEYGLLDNIGRFSWNDKLNQQGSVYIGRGKNKLNALAGEKNEKFMQAIRGEIPIIKEIQKPQFLPADNPWSRPRNPAFNNELKSSLKQLGVKVDLNPVEKFVKSQRENLVTRRNAKRYKGLI
jgi:hypothetical protein